MKCKRCGKCCANLILEIPVEDPRLTPPVVRQATPMRGGVDNKITHLSFNRKTPPHRCVFLKRNRCSIHRKRPQLCRDFKAGKRNEQCFGYNGMEPVEVIPG